MQDNYLELESGKIWYTKIGDSPHPLLVIHGGPGLPSDYLRTLDALADQYTLVYYDQLGCGKSTRTRDEKFFKLSYFIGELKQLIGFLGLKKFSLFAHSWGTLVALSVAASSESVQNLILASPCISMPRWQATAHRLLNTLPKGHTYLQAHECRLPEKPEALTRAQAGFNAYEYMSLWGQNEYTVTGSLKDFDLSSLLAQVHCPTLFTCGKFDTASPEDTAYYQSLVPQSELVVFNESSHLPHLEEPERYMSTIRQFLKILE